MTDTREHFTANKTMACAIQQPKWTQDEYGTRIKTVGMENNG
ncbi:hypothetical protein ACPFTZ_001928 [Vibrio cholerae]|nr:hypothetical protein [Vibrio cholerae]GIC23300.1 hypothetical protein VCSRO146_1895 [Vibrio cholerae]